MRRSNAASRRKALTGLALFLCAAVNAEVEVWTDGQFLTVSANDHSTAGILREIAVHHPLQVESAVSLDLARDFEVVERDAVFVIRRLLRGRNHIIVRDDTGSITVNVFGNAADRRTSIPGVTTDDGEEPRWADAAAAFLDADPDVRIDALDMLVALDPVAAFELVRSATSDPHDRVRIAAIELLGEAGASQALQGAWWVLPAAQRILVVDALGDIEDSRSSAFLRVIAASDNAALAAVASDYLDERDR